MAHACDAAARALKPRGAVAQAHANVRPLPCIDRTHTAHRAVWTSRSGVSWAAASWMSTSCLSSPLASRVRCTCRVLCTVRCVCACVCAGGQAGGGGGGGKGIESVCGCSRCMAALLLAPTVPPHKPHRMLLCHTHKLRRLSDSVAARRGRQHAAGGGRVVCCRQRQQHQQQRPAGACCCVCACVRGVGASVDCHHQHACARPTHKLTHTHLRTHNTHAHTCTCARTHTHTHTHTHDSQGSHAVPGQLLLTNTMQALKRLDKPGTLQQVHAPRALCCVVSCCVATCVCWCGVAASTLRKHTHTHKEQSAAHHAWCSLAPCCRAVWHAHPHTAGRAAGVGRHRVWRCRGRAAAALPLPAARSRGPEALCVHILVGAGARCGRRHAGAAC
jgi:hypothetical protein